MHNKILRILFPVLAIICILILLLWNQLDKKEIDQANFLVTAHKTMADRVYIHLTSLGLDHNREFPPDRYRYIKTFGPDPSIKMDEFSSDGMPAFRGIRITIWLGYMDLSRGACSELLYSRAKLIVDGVLVSNTSLKIAVAQEGGVECNKGFFYFSWLPKLDIGDHKVIFLLTDDNGVVWEKSWQFTLYP